MRNKFSGFTIIEVMVVVAVISILATIGTAKYTEVQRNTRDKERVADIEIVQTALEIFYDKNGYYPSEPAFLQGSVSYASNSTVIAGENFAAITNFRSKALSLSESATRAPLDEDVFSFIENNRLSSMPGGTLPTEKYLYTPFSESPNYITLNRYVCLSSPDCTKYELKYRKESDGQIITVKSKYGW